MVRIQLACGTLLLASVAGAERAAPEPATIIAPLVDGNTYVVARVDVGRINVEDFVERIAVADLLDSTMRDNMRRALPRARDQFIQAGGRDVYLLAHLTDSPMLPFTLLVPLPKDADAMKLTAFLRGWLPGPQEAVERIGSFVVAGQRSSLERLKKIKPAASPVLAAAFRATGDHAIQVVVLPPADLRRVVAELAPTLPPELGGGPSTVLTRGVRWLALGCNGLPQNELSVVIKSADAEAARALQDVIAKALAGVIKEVLARQQPAQPGDPTVMDAIELTRNLAALKPAVKGDQLVVTVGDKAFSESAGTLVRLARGPALRSRGMNNLKEFALAYHNFASTYGRFPANIVDKDGKPLLSWRVAILPYLDQDRLYKEFHLDEPWDSEHNKKLLPRMPAVFRRPTSRAEPSRTTYLMPVGKDTVLADNAQGLIFQDGLKSRDAKKKGIRLQDITDGTSNTLLVADVTDHLAVPWTKPDDWVPDAADPRKGLVGSTPGGFLAAFADGSAHFFRAAVSPKTLRALLTRNGGEVLTPDW